MNAREFSISVLPPNFIRKVVDANTTVKLKTLLAQLPIADESKAAYDGSGQNSKWENGKFHWVPLGKDRGNAGRIKLAPGPVNPIAERTVNSMEALIELERRRELLQAPSAPMPRSPREAVSRYFALPPLDTIPDVGQIRDMPAQKYARELARKIQVRIQFEKAVKEFAVFIEDAGIGQSPLRMHETLLSLGSSDKGDKPYLIGLFGQGGSSTFAASEISWCLSRRASDLGESAADGVGWTVIKQVFPKDRRDSYYAYLAADSSGAVPFLPAESAEEIGLIHGSRFAHLGYNFSGGVDVMRGMYQMLNHILFNPVIPFDLLAGTTEATIYGNGYRLSNARKKNKTLLDKSFLKQSLNREQ